MAFPDVPGSLKLPLNQLVSPGLARRRGGGQLVSVVAPAGSPSATPCDSGSARRRDGNATQLLGAAVLLIP